MTTSRELTDKLNGAMDFVKQEGVPKAVATATKSAWHPPGRTFEMYEQIFYFVEQGYKGRITISLMPDEIEVAEG